MKYLEDYGLRSDVVGFRAGFESRIDCKSQNLKI